MVHFLPMNKFIFIFRAVFYIFYLLFIPIFNSFLFDSFLTPSFLFYFDSFSGIIFLFKSYLLHSFLILVYFEFIFHFRCSFLLIAYPFILFAYFYFDIYNSFWNLVFLFDSFFNNLILLYLDLFSNIDSFSRVWVHFLFFSSFRLLAYLYTLFVYF